MQAENTEDALEIKNSSIYTNKKIAASFINNLKEKILIIIKKIIIKIIPHLETVDAQVKTKHLYQTC